MVSDAQGPGEPAKLPSDSVIAAVSDLTELYRQSLRDARSREERLQLEVDALRSELADARRAAELADEQLVALRAELTAAEDRERKMLGAVRTYLGHTDSAFVAVQAAAIEAVEALEQRGAPEPLPSPAPAPLS